MRRAAVTHPTKVAARRDGYRATVVRRRVGMHSATQRSSDARWWVTLRLPTLRGATLLPGLRPGGPRGS